MNKSLLKLEIVTEINNAEKIWKELSPNKFIYDTWEYRFCYYKHNPFPLHFVVGKVNNKPVALLPLQNNTINGYLEFFASEYSEDNRIFILPEFKDLTPVIYESVKDKFYSTNLTGDKSIIDKLQFDHIVYTLSLNDTINLAEFIDNYYLGSPKHRKKLKGELNKFEKNEIKIIKNNYKDLELFFKLKIQHFGADTCFNDEKEQDAFRDFIKLNYDFHMYSYEINGFTSGVTVAVFFNNRYVFLHSACDQGQFPFLTKYAFLKNIEEAIRLKAITVETSRGGENWKNRWNFIKISQFFYKNY